MDDSNWANEIRKRTKKVPFKSGRSNKAGKVSFDDLVFIPAQLSKRPIDYFKEEIKSETIVGKKSKKPMKISAPIIIGAMSFGALSKEAKIALAKASTEAGIIASTGEGGMLPEERESADKLILQYSTGRFGISEETLQKADAIEIKIGQGAKPGSGGLLLKNKITPEIAKIRGVSDEEDIHSPAYHKDINNLEDLREKIDWLREKTEGVPIIVKLGPGDVEEDVEIAIKAGCDIVAIDGMEGGTGAAPDVMLNEVGLPTIATLVRARKKIDEMNSDCELWIGGGFNKGGDIAKAIALGADAVFIGFPFLICMGCTYCQLCHLGKCLKGVATQDVELRKNFKMEESVENSVNFINACKEEVKMIAGAVGKNDIYDLSNDDIRALKQEIAQGAGIKTVWDN